MGSALVFLSYSHADKEFANRLKTDLESLGLSVWQDHKEIQPGEGILGKIEPALDHSDYFLLILSRSSISSKWVDLEYRIALHSQMERGKPWIIPIRFHDVDLPGLIRDRQYVDFVKDYDNGWSILERFFGYSELRGIRVGGGTGMGIYLLKLILTRFRERFPDLPIQERIDISEELIKAVASDLMGVSLDAAVVGKIPDDHFKQTVECQEIFRDTSVLIVFPGHPLWGKKSISKAQLHFLLAQGTSFVSRPKGSGQYKSMLNYLAPVLGKIEAEILLDRLVAYDIDAAKRFVSQGLGISIMPNIIVREEVSSGRAWAIRLPGNPYRPFYGVWAKKRRYPTIVETFIMMLKEGLKVK